MGLEWKAYLWYIVITLILGAVAYYLGAGWVALLFGASAAITVLTWIVDYAVYWVEKGDENDESAST